MSRFIDSLGVGNERVEDLFGARGADEGSGKLTREEIIKTTEPITDWDSGSVSLFLFGVTGYWSAADMNWSAADIRVMEGGMN